MWAWISVVVGLQLVLVGYRILSRQELFFLIGYSDNTLSGDKKKFAVRTGTMVMILGCLLVMYTVLGMIVSETALTIFKVFIFLYVIALIGLSQYWRFRN